MNSQTFWIYLRMSSLNLAHNTEIVNLQKEVPCKSDTKWHAPTYFY